MYNNKEVQELFEKECVLIGHQDVIPEYIVEEIFGKDAAEFTKKVDYKSTNGYGIGDFTLMYFTYKGFQTAATFYNVSEIRKILRGRI